MGPRRMCFFAVSTFRMGPVFLLEMRALFMEVVFRAPNTCTLFVALHASVAWVPLLTVVALANANTPVAFVFFMALRRIVVLIANVYTMS